MSPHGNNPQVYERVGAAVLLRICATRRAILCLMGVLLLSACAGGESATVQTATLPITPTIGIPATSRLETQAPRPPTAVGSATAGASPPSASAYPTGCTPAEVEAFLDRFLAAFNQDDMVALRAFFPVTATGQSIPDSTGEKFVWYSMTDNRLDGSKRHFVAYDLPTLWAYFAERHTHQERLRLASVRVSQQDSFTANMTLYLYRTADDVPPDAGFPAGQATGKAVMNCRDQTLRVLSLGQGGVATPTPTR